MSWFHLSFLNLQSSCHPIHPSRLIILSGSIQEPFFYHFQLWREPLKSLCATTGTKQQQPSLTGKLYSYHCITDINETGSCSQNFHNPTQLTEIDTAHNLSFYLVTSLYPNIYVAINIYGCEKKIILLLKKISSRATFTSQLLPQG